MNVSLYQAAAAMNAHAQWQEVIAGNLSASVIPGSKKQDLNISSFEAGLMQAGEAAKLRHQIPQAKITTNFRPGELKPTNKELDMAIQGSGFFEVQMADGRLGYTRDGEFSLNSQGQLVTKQGHVVIGDGGPIQMETNSGGPITVTPNGEVSQGRERRGRLKVIDFPEPSRLTPIGSGLYAANSPDLKPEQVRNPVIMQGFTESANTSSVVEMAQLIGVMRAFEANQKVIQMQDDRMGRVISELGHTS